MERVRGVLEAEVAVLHTAARELPMALEAAEGSLAEEEEEKGYVVVPEALALPLLKSPPVVVKKVKM